MFLKTSRRINHYSQDYEFRYNDLLWQALHRKPYHICSVLLWSVCLFVTLFKGPTCAGSCCGMFVCLLSFLWVSNVQSPAASCWLFVCSLNFSKVLHVKGTSDSCWLFVCLLHFSRVSHVQSHAASCWLFVCLLTFSRISNVQGPSASCGVLWTPWLWLLFHRAVYTGEAVTRGSHITGHLLELI